jgi:Mn2+/Fe2+ NRAMP family transporter
MPDNLQIDSALQKGRQMLTEAGSKGPLARLAAYLKLSGPGWLQGATTLGGGSLSSSLYLGVLVGFGLLWLQPLAMVLGIIMLSAIAYITLSTGQRPFRAINEYVSPVLGWAWLIASMTANLVWSMPQFALGTAAIQQNLFRNILGQQAMPDPAGKILASLCILAVCLTVVMFYSKGGWGLKLFEIIVKSSLSMVVLCFFGVVVKISIEGLLDWPAVLHGLVPDLRLLTRPAQTFTVFLSAVEPHAREFWTSLIVRQQRDVIISAASTAVGINMTFLFPYSMLRKGWDVQFRGFAVFDLAAGLFIPYVLATGCVVIASASQFHTVPAPGFLGETTETGQAIQPPSNLVAPYKELMMQRLKYETGADKFDELSSEEKTRRIKNMPAADKKIAAMLVTRDAFNLAESLAPLTGRTFSHLIFGIGVLGMAMNAVTMLMLINGFVFCEMLNVPPTGWPSRLGSAMVCVGVLGALFWKQAKLWLAVPTSMFAMVLLPIAYFTFYLLMNQKRLLGEYMPRGSKRIAWNILMAVAAAAAAFGSLWTVWSKLGLLGIGLVAAFVVVVLVVHIVRPARSLAPG